MPISAFLNTPYPQYQAISQRKTSIHQPALNRLPSVDFGSKTPKRHIAILTTNVEGNYAPKFQDLLNQIQSTGRDFLIIHPQDLTIQTDTSGVSLWIKNTHYDKPPFDILLPMIGARYVTEGSLNAIEAIEAMGVDVINPAQAIRRGENKMNTHLGFATKGIPQPVTQYRPAHLTLGTDQSINTYLLERLLATTLHHGKGIAHLDALGEEAVIKANAFTSSSRGIHQGHSVKELLNTELTPDVIAQENVAKYTPVTEVDTIFGRVPIEIPTNFRVMVFNGQVVKSTAKSMSGFIQDVGDNAELTRLALDAMSAAGLRYGTVDIQYNIEKDSLKVLEVNPCPSTFSNELEPLLQHVDRYQSSSPHRISTFA